MIFDAHSDTLTDFTNKILKGENNIILITLKGDIFYTYRANFYIYNMKFALLQLYGNITKSY